MSIADLVSGIPSIVLVITWRATGTLREILSYRLAYKALDKANSSDVSSVLTAHHGRFAPPSTSGQVTVQQEEHGPQSLHSA